MKFTMCLAGLIGLLLLNQSPSSAQCIGPYITLNISSVAPGGMVTVIGRYFTDGCHDVVLNGVVTPTLPAKNVRLFLVQGSHIEQIGTVDADKTFKISATLTIPANTPVGDATIIADSGYAKTRPVAISVKAKESEPPTGVQPRL